VKLVHAADLHIDSPLRGLSRYPEAPVERIRGATREALRGLVDLCIEESAAALLLAGDVFDGDWPDYATGLYFVAEMRRLREAGVRVLSIRGNHDAQSRISRALTLPENVTELSTAQPQTVRDESLGLAVHGQGFARQETFDDLAAGYPDALPGLLNIGLLHTSLDGRPGHQGYAPTRIDQLANKGYAYWALGHVHAREVVARDEPWIVYPGNLQGRHVREPGPKGATVISVEDGRIASVEHRTLDVVRFGHVVIDARDLDSPATILARARERLADASAAASPRLLAARITVTGESRAHDLLARDADRFDNDVRAAAIDLGDVWIEKVRLSTRARIDLDERLARDDGLGTLLRRLRAAAGAPEAIARHAEVLEDLRGKLPLEARDGDDAIALDDAEYLASALRDATELLLPRLLARSDA
jgi:DNA repair protein SbcD/Mre11